MISQNISHYKILDKLGEGGMGVVYKAHDTRLDRIVALKFLPAEISRNEENIERFIREAKAASSLDHPNICTIHDINETPEGQLFIVMPAYEGGTLAEKIKRGPLNLDEVLDIAVQIADGLQAAHEKHIVHRDIKSSNIFITDKGQVKIMDFGLAQKSNLRDITKTNVIMGTVPYISPEQIRGEKLDHRTDIWSFGIILYEMIANRLPFQSEYTEAVVYAILKEDAALLTSLRSDVSYKLEWIVNKCLEKNKNERYQHNDELIIDLRRVRNRIGDEAGLISGTQNYFTGNLPKDKNRSRKLINSQSFIIATLIFTFLFSTFLLFPSRNRNMVEPVRIKVTLPQSVTITRGSTTAQSVALSPNGRLIVIAGTGKFGQLLYLRSLNQIEPIPIEGTDGGMNPFFSPDGSWIGFFVDGRLRRVSVRGGPVIDVAAAPGMPFGASWGPDDRIVFVSGPRSQLSVVNAFGGATEKLIEFDTTAGEYSQRFPQIISNGRIVLFDWWGPQGLSIDALDISSGRRITLTRGFTPRYSTNGYLLYGRGTTLFAARFNPAHLKLTGPAIPLVENVATEANAIIQYDLSMNSNLLYVPGDSSNEFVLVDTGGGEQLITEEPLFFLRPRFSADGRHIAVSVSRGTGYDIWIYDIKTRASFRLTFDNGWKGVWMPNGKKVTYSIRGAGLFSRSLDGLEDSEKLLEISEWNRPIGWTPDGRTLAYEAIGDEGIEASIWMLQEGENRRLIREAWGGSLSYDGRWLAYHSNISGRYEVYVTSFPDCNAIWQISAEGGRDPVWGYDSTKVYYRNGNRIISAKIDKTTGVRVHSKDVVIEQFNPPRFDDYDIHPDGKSLVMVRTTTSSDAVLVINWSTELQRRVN
jgi:serine/threonine protein kinase